MERTKAFREIIITEKDCSTWKLATALRKNNSVRIAYKNDKNKSTKRFFEIWGTSESRTSNAYAIWTGVELTTNDKVIKKSTYKDWTLCYMYIVDKSALKSVIAELEKAYANS